MSHDLAVWYPDHVLSDEQALQQYQKLCDEDSSELTPHPSIGSFYLELYKMHPEIDDVPEANCITENVTLRGIVASGKMLLSDRRKRRSEEQHDESEKQARVVGSCATTVVESGKS